MVLLISLGITTLPRSSILLTIPVAFIYHKSPLFSFGTKVFCVNKGFLCKENGGSYEDINHYAESSKQDFGITESKYLMQHSNK